MSTALESEILGQLILAPQLLESCDGMLQGSLFSTPDYRKAFAGIFTLWEELRPKTIDCGILVEKTGLSLGFIAGLVNGNFRPDPGNFAWRVRELKRRRASARILKLAQDEAQALVKTGEIDPAKLQELREAWRELDEIHGGPPAERSLWQLGRTFGELQLLDIKVDWVVNQLIPEKAITLIHAPGGAGKTWVGLDLARAVSTGTPFLGIPTQKRPVLYVDYEMPLALMRERTIGLNIQEGRLWNISDDPRPPRLDSDDWDIFLQAKDAVVIFDSLRSAHSKPGNDDEVAAFVMDRVKQIRQRDASPVLIHHTPRANERTSKGSTAWTDLSDHVLSLHRVQPKTFRPIEDDGAPDPNAVYYFGTGEKSRYSPFHLYLRRAPTGELELAQDPSQLILDSIRAFLVGKPGGATQSEVCRWAKEALDITSKGRMVMLLNKGDGRLWSSSISGTSRYYVAI